MDIKIFDSYNIRARVSVYIIIIALIILTLYVVCETVRSFTFSVVLVAIMASFSNYLLALQRYKKWLIHMLQRRIFSIWLCLERQRRNREMKKV